MKFEPAEELYKRSLAIREKALGPDNLEVAASLNNLGELYQTQRKFEKAEPLLKRAYGIRAKALGEKDPDRLATQKNLWALYVSTGKFNDAEEYTPEGEITPNLEQSRRRNGAPQSPRGTDPTR